MEPCRPAVVETESAISTVHKQVVIVQDHVWKKIHGWCKAARSEVSGLGLVRLTDRGMEVYDVFLPKQKCSSGYTELDELATPRLITKLHKTKRRTQDLRFWWHTHFNFGVFWSSTDDNNAREMVETNGDWLLSIVINQKGEYRCRVDTVKPIRSTLDKLTVYIGKDDRKSDSRKRNFKTDIKRYVSPMTYGGPNEHGTVNYVGGQQFANRWGDDKRTGYDDYSGYGWGGHEYHGGYDPYATNAEKKQEDNSKAYGDWWDKYEARMKEKGKIVKRPDWLKRYTKDEKKIIPPTKDDRIVRPRAEDIEDFAGTRHTQMELGNGHIYHGGMFLTEDQYLWALDTGKVPDNPEDKADCDAWILANSGGVHYYE